ncbi:hypothetical protein FGU71_08830 [Erythrobacter insulae]|uniref:DUF4384 domain-containing protein n=1 Tax=Erythrobacter insulae TaxID=2584124 RepID=A0A547PCT4_9SPHN|nr:hypothetical protein [Erythrobacter insulae]TRD11949.1 hypothetical protein FGU71_08830 [Erythrobacter insulae]
MFSAKVKTRIAGLALAAAIFAAPAAAMAGVVVKSTGPSSAKYPVGAKVADTATITLKAGDSITVLTSRGTKVMKGAGSFKVGERPKATRARFSALTRKRAANRVRTGAVRGSNDASVTPTNPNLWYVDVTQGGTICLNDLGAVRFWRPDSTAIATYKISNDDGSADITFDAKDSVTPLDPVLMSITPGGTYSISSLAEGGTSAEVTFAFIEGDYGRADQLAEALIAAGCNTQLSQLADRLAE